MNSAVAALENLNAEQLREMVSGLLQKVSSNAAQIQFKQALIDKLTHENAVLKRLKFGLKSEKMNAEQRSLLDETLDADLAAVADEIAQALPDSAAAKERLNAKPCPQTCRARPSRTSPSPPLAQRPVAAPP